MSREEKKPKGMRERRLVKKPEWIDHIEAKIAHAVPVHPNIISAAKLFILLPLLVLAMKQVAVLSGRPWLIITLFFLFVLFDYLDGTVARHRHLETGFGRVFDRITDYPILLMLSYFCIELIPLPFLIGKLAVDLLLMILYILGMGSTENRIRTGMSYTTLLALLLLSQGWAPRLITPELVIYLLILGISFSSIVALYNMRILQKRFIADALSGANLLCGVFSMIFAYQGRFEISLLFLMLGAAFDGFDGAAARRFGGTRMGVYSDDIADGINYGIAPGVALYFFLGGTEGMVVGIFYSFFTITRLVFFTLNKSYGDPEYFCGVPSTVGAVVALCSIILFKHQPAIVGFMVGVACILMVSFDTNFRHLGRAMSSNRRIIYGIPVFILLLVTGYLFFGIKAPVAIILAASILYGFLPFIMHFVNIIGKRSEPV